MKGLAIAIRAMKPMDAMGKGKEHDGDDEYAAVGDELADVLDVPEEKREAFFEALHSFIKLCHTEEMGEGEHEEEKEY